MSEKTPPACIACTHHPDTGFLSCSAYPAGIPGEILSGRIRHDVAYKGDNGIRFKRTRNHPAYFIVDDPPEKFLFRITMEGLCELYIPLMDSWEQDDDFIRCLMESGLPFRETGIPEADEYVETRRRQKAAINPCSLQFRQMMYLRTRNNPE